MWREAEPFQTVKPEIIQHEPDGSEAQTLLGGPIQALYKFISRDE